MLTFKAAPWILEDTVFAETDRGAQGSFEMNWEGLKMG